MMLYYRPLNQQSKISSGSASNANSPVRGIANGAGIATVADGTGASSPFPHMPSQHTSASATAYPPSSDNSHNNIAALQQMFPTVRMSSGAGGLPNRGPGGGGNAVNLQQQQQHRQFLFHQQQQQQMQQQMIGYMTQQQWS